MHTTYSLKKITNTDDFGFDPNDYSRFKFGDDQVAREFGFALAEGFIQERLSEEPIEGQIVVISSPYAFIPTATFAMKNYFVFRLNDWLAKHGFPVVEETKVHRTTTYKEDYGELSAEERMRLIGNDRFHIDAGFVSGKTLIFLDDIRITGSHERMIVKMVENYRLENAIHLLYFAELVNKAINPNVENFLNYHYVKSVFNLDPIIKSGHFNINTRIVKYLLNSDPAELSIFIAAQSRQFVELLYHMAISNNYHIIESYSRNLVFIREYLFSNNQKLILHGD